MRVQHLTGNTDIIFNYIKYYLQICCIIFILYIGGVMTCWQQLRSKSDFRDVTLVCDEGKMKAHKFIITFTNCSH